MTEYIERGKIFAVWRSMPAPASVQSLSAAIHQTPVADVAPVVHGKWNRILRGNYECSRCGCIPYYAGSIYTLHYCPNCGADMRERKDND